MERSSKLADLKLVSKYYPVMNYSYPQQPERLSQCGIGHLSDDRASLGSEGSTPGLIEDRTDSEASLDDDYQYHAHAAELWDSFWLPSKKDNLEPRPRKQYPALIPSPQQQRRQAEERCISAWPLPESPRPRSRKPVATYSPFPKPRPLPPRAISMIPSWQCSRTTQDKPHRPPRPDDDVYVYRSLQNSPLVANFPTSPDPYTTNFSRPVSPKEHRPTVSLEIRPATPIETETTMCAAGSCSESHLPLLGSQTVSPFLLTKRSVPCLRPLPPEPRSEAEPHSVFEDSDSDSESHGGRSFWFHRRSGSDQRKTGHRTAPSSPRKRPGGVVIGRILGRRSKE
ncbi:hypothetical protein FZEAL_5062 [Fusarium zealandicum]|uniref:Uncharacterized protein n=1 Tax=Fusarium zealandicum TaxID=1053134 RepID=A0A8H4UL78_9HYPO|nr:hypothetical protein FZEAL_5062 [Fusarium zealandicum]